MTIKKTNPKWKTSKYMQIQRNRKKHQTNVSKSGTPKIDISLYGSNNVAEAREKKKMTANKQKQGRLEQTAEIYPVVEQRA